MNSKRVFLGIVLFLGIFSCLWSKEVNANQGEITYLEGREIHYSKQVELNDKNYLVVATDQKLYFIYEEKIERVIEINSEVKDLFVLEDINNNTYQDVLVLTKSKMSDNILTFDSKEYSLLFKYSAKMLAYDTERGYYDEIIPVDDVVLDRHTGVFIAGYHVFSLNLTNGQLNWKVEASNNLWDIELIGDINDDAVTDVAVSIQNSDILTLSGMNGKRIYQKSVSEDVTIRKEVVPTSIWSMQYDEDRKILYACSQNGKVYQLDATTGDVIDSKQVMELTSFDKDMYYFNYQQSYFKKLSIELVDDIDGDQINDLVYYQLIDISNKADHVLKEPLEGVKQSIRFLSGTNLEVLPNYIDLDYTKSLHVYKGYFDDQEVFYVLDHINSTNKEYKIFSIRNNAFLNEKITIDHYSNDKQMNLLKINATDSIVINHYGVLFIKNNAVTRMIPLVSYSDFIHHDKQVLIQNGISQVGYFSIECVSLETLNPIWTYTLSQALLLKEVYINQVDYSTDFNKDGILDVLLFLSSGTYTVPSVVLLDGSNGTLLSEINIAIPELDINVSSYDAFLDSNGYYNSNIINSGIVNDLNNDSVKDLYVVNSNGEMYFLNVYNGQILNYFSNNETIHYSSRSHYTPLTFWNTHMIGDINGDGFNDFYQVTQDLISRQYEMKLLLFGELFEIHSTNGLQGDFANEFTKLGDVDNDSLSDYGFFTYINDQHYFHVISSKTGEEIANILASYNDYFYMSHHDINHDGLKELFKISITRDGFGSVELLDITNKYGTILWGNYDYYYFDMAFYYEQQVANVFYHDGILKLALHIKSYNGGEEILIYDLATSQFIDQVAITKMDHDFTPTLCSFKIIENNGMIYFYATHLNNDIDPFYQDDLSHSNRSFVYNYTKKEINFNLVGSSFNKLVIIDDHVILKKNDATVILKQINNQLEIKSLTNRQKVSNHLDLHFIKDEGDVYIYVDDTLVGQTNDDRYQLKLLTGTHHITISQIDSDGVELTHTVVVQVETNQFYVYFMGFIVFFLFSLTVVYTRFRPNYAKYESGDIE